MSSFADNGLLMVPRGDDDMKESRAKQSSFRDISNGRANGVHNQTEAASKGERVIAIARVWNEVETKHKRSILAGQFPRYLYFLIIYLIALHHQKSAEPLYNLRETFKEKFVVREYMDPMTRVSGSFQDIGSVSDVWTWMEVLFMPSFYELYWTNGEPKDDYYKTVLSQQNRIADGFRITQRRAVLNQQCVLSAKYGGFFPFCYSDLGPDGLGPAADTSPFGPYYNQGKYTYSSNFTSGVVDSGYVVEIKTGLNDTLKQIAALKADRWIDEATQWVRIDFMTVNPSLSMLCQTNLIIHFDVSGLVRTEYQSHVLKTGQYLDTTRDYIQIVLEVLVVVGVFMYIIGDVKDMCMGGGITAFYSDPWNVLGTIQMILFLIDAIVWLIVITDPTRSNLVVKLGPTMANVASNRDVTLDYVASSSGGSTPSLAQAAVAMRSYFCIQSITLAASLLRLFKYMMALSFLSSLVETLVLLRPALTQFATLVVTTNTAFAYMGYIMFGDVMAEFRTWDQSFYTLWATLLGEGINYAQLFAANPQGAAILYVPFVLFYSMILLHLVVAVVVEAYQVQQAQRSRTVDGWRQFKDGIFRRFVSLRKYQDQTRKGLEGHYNQANNDKVYEWLKDFLDWSDPAVAEVELTKQELLEGRPHLVGLRDKKVTMAEVDFIFTRYEFCTRLQDPPPAEPEFMDLLRDLQRQVRVLTDAHALCQRKLDAVIAGQTM